MKKFALLFVLFLFSSAFLTTLISAQAAESAEINENEETEKGGIKFPRELFFQVSTLPEAKIGFNQHFIFPVFQGDRTNPLIKDNNVDLSLSAEATPISFDAILKAVLQPIAFLKFTIGGKAGSGWAANIGSNILGIGFNVPDDQGNEKYDGSAFDSVNWRIFTGGLFQFDLAAVFPGDWNHVVMQTYHEISYRANSRATDGESWYYENDDGENRNGMMYFGNITLGYQMPRRPIFLNMIAVQAEMESYLYDESGGKDWGDDLVRWRLAPVIQFKFTDDFEVFLLAQFRTLRNFTNYNYGKDEKLYYKNRILDTSDPLRMEFYRVAAAVVYKF